MSISPFIESNRLVLHFGYPLIFFLMGFGILLKNTVHSRFFLAKSLRYLALFGILHGVSDWGTTFIPIQESYLTPSYFFILESIRIVLNAVSFCFLFYFGLHLLVQTLDWNHRMLLIPPIILLVWITNFIFLQPFLLNDHNQEWWFAISDIWSRYLLGFPGAAISSYALYKQREQFLAFGAPSMTRILMFSAISTGLYALVGGIVVPYAPVLPALLFNSDLFFTTTGLPVELFRGISGFFMSFFILKILKVFDMEYLTLMYDAEMQRTVLNNRTQIARDLHDGTIQSIYAIGLQIERMRNMLSSRDEDRIHRAQTELEGIIERLNHIIRETRSYIKKLKMPVDAQINMEQEIGRIIKELNAGDHLQLDWKNAYTGREPPLSQVLHICYIVKEALSNVLRHSGATRAEVILSGDDCELRVDITDNGSGFQYNPSSKEDSNALRQGITNMKYRAHVINGKLVISSQKDAGTRLSLIVKRGLEGAAWGKQ